MEKILRALEWHSRRLKLKYFNFLRDFHVLPLFQTNKSWDVIKASHFGLINYPRAVIILRQVFSEHKKVSISISFTRKVL